MSDPFDIAFEKAGGSTAVAERDPFDAAFEKSSAPTSDPFESAFAKTLSPPAAPEVTADSNFRVGDFAAGAAAGVQSAAGRQGVADVPAPQSQTGNVPSGGWLGRMTKEIASTPRAKTEARIALTDSLRANQVEAQQAAGRKATLDRFRRDLGDETYIEPLPFNAPGYKPRALRYADMNDDALDVELQRRVHSGTYRPPETFGETRQREIAGGEYKGRGVLLARAPQFQGMTPQQASEAYARLPDTDPFKRATEQEVQMIAERRQSGAPDMSRAPLSLDPEEEVARALALGYAELSAPAEAMAKGIGALAAPAGGERQVIEELGRGSREFRLEARPSTDLGFTGRVVTGAIESLPMLAEQIALGIGTGGAGFIVPALVNVGGSSYNNTLDMLVQQGVGVGEAQAHAFGKAVADMFITGLTTKVQFGWLANNAPAQEAVRQSVASYVARQWFKGAAGELTQEGTDQIGQELTAALSRALAGVPAENINDVVLRIVEAALAGGLVGGPTGFLHSQRPYTEREYQAAKSGMANYADAYRRARGEATPPSAVPAPVPDIGYQQQVAGETAAPSYTPTPSAAAAPVAGTEYDIDARRQQGVEERAQERPTAAPQPPPAPIQPVAPPPQEAVVEAPRPTVAPVAPTGVTSKPPDSPVQPPVPPGEAGGVLPVQPSPPVSGKGEVTEEMRKAGRHKRYLEKEATRKAAEQTERESLAKYESNRKEIGDNLVASGAQIEHTSDSGSVYYRIPEGTDAEGYVRDPLLIRVSDHYVPETDERAYNRERGQSGQPWDHEIIVTAGTNVAKELDRVLPDDLKPVSGKPEQDKGKAGEPTPTSKESLQVRPEGGTERTETQPVAVGDNVTYKGEPATVTRVGPKSLTVKMADGQRRFVRDAGQVQRVEAKIPVQTPTAQETPDASRQSKAAALHGDVRAQPVEGQGKVPVEGRGEGVQPQAEGKGAPKLEDRLDALADKFAAMRKNLRSRTAPGRRGGSTILPQEIVLLAGEALVRTFSTGVRFVKGVANITGDAYQAIKKIVTDAGGHDRDIRRVVAAYRELAQAHLSETGSLDVDGLERSMTSEGAPPSDEPPIIERDKDEPSPPGMTSLRQVDLEEMMKAIGLHDKIPSPSVRHDAELLEKVLGEWDTDRTDNLFAELATTGRTPADEEVVAMEVALARLNKTISDLSRQYDQATDPATRAALDGQIQNLINKAENQIPTAHAAGTEQGRAFRARQITLLEDMSLVRVLHRARQNRPGQTEIPSAERAEYERIIREIEKSNAELKARYDRDILSANRRNFREAARSERGSIPTSPDAIVSRIKKLLEMGCAN